MAQTRSMERSDSSNVASEDRRLKYKYDANARLGKVEIDFPYTGKIYELQLLFSAEIERRHLIGVFLQSRLDPRKPTRVAVVGYGQILQTPGVRRDMLSIAQFVLEAMEKTSTAAAKRP